MQSKARRGMIGKSLQERHGLGSLDGARAVVLLQELLGSHAKPIIEVRAQGEDMVACVVAHADEASVRLCRRLGFDLRPGGVGVFGIRGQDAGSLIPGLPGAAWLSSPCGPRETKVLLIAEGRTAVLSIESADGKVTITPR